MAATNTLLSGGGTFSCLIYDVGWDGTPATQATHHVEAIEVTSGAATLNWQGTTENGWTATTHANGSVVVATVLTPRSLTQQMVDHTTVATTPLPHDNVYVQTAAFTAKGGLLIAAGNASYLQVPLGPDGDILTADSTQTTGVRWASSGVASVLQHMGDLIVGGLLGVATRLGVGSIGQGLVVAQNASSVANPLVGPTCGATSSGGSLVNGTQYDFAFAWQTPNGPPDGGITQISPITTFTATATGVVQVQCGAAPSPNLTLIVYAAVHGGSLQQQGTLSNASTSTSNNINVSSIISGNAPSQSNTTGGISATWGTVGSVTSVGISLPAEFTVSNSPVTGTGTLAVGWANQNANLVHASPAVGVGQPAFRALVANDLPFLPRHEQFAPTSGTLITLSRPAFVVSIVAKNGTVLQEAVVATASASLSATATMDPVQSGSAGPAALSATASMQVVGSSSAAGLPVYTVAGAVLTFSTAFVPGDRVVVAYSG